MGGWGVGEERRSIFSDRQSCSCCSDFFVSGVFFVRYGFESKPFVGRGREGVVITSPVSPFCFRALFVIFSPRWCTTKRQSSGFHPSVGHSVAHWRENRWKPGTIRPSGQKLYCRSSRWCAVIDLCVFARCYCAIVSRSETYPLSMRILLAKHRLADNPKQDIEA